MSNFAMQINDEHIAEFQALYLKNFGEKISREDAYEKGVKLLRLMSIIYKPMTEEDFHRVQERRKTLQK